jgi:hypothetical protein
MIKFIKKSTDRNGKVGWYVFYLTEDRYTVVGYAKYSEAKDVYRTWSPFPPDMTDIRWFNNDYGHMFNRLSYQDIYKANLKHD